MKKMHQVRCPYCNARLFDSRVSVVAVPYEDEADISITCWRKRCEWGRALHFKRVDKPGEGKAEA